MENSYRNIGKIVSGFGLKGEMIIQHHLGKNCRFKINVIFLEQKGRITALFRGNCQEKGDDELYLKLEGIDSREAATKYLRREVWMKEEEIQIHTQKNNPIGWVGYRIIDQGRDLGPIQEVIEQPHQVLCRLEIDAREVLIPINEQTLEKVDHKSRSLLVCLPDGLLEIYLS